MNLFITGYTGNVGKATGDYLDSINVPYIVGLRNPEAINLNNPICIKRHFDFCDQTTYHTALENVQTVLLIRPPNLTDVAHIFAPFIDACEKNQVKHIVFLSLLGIENNPFPPHRKIEKLIQNSTMAYTFIRPGFFMQNLIDPHRTQSHILSRSCL